MSTTLPSKRKRASVSYAEPDINDVDDEEDLELEDSGYVSEDDGAFGSRKVRAPNPAPPLETNNLPRSHASLSRARLGRSSLCSDPRRRSQRRHSRSCLYPLSCAMPSTNLRLLREMESQ